MHSPNAVRANRLELLTISANATEETNGGTHYPIEASLTSMKLLCRWGECHGGYVHAVVCLNDIVPINRRCWSRHRLVEMKFEACVRTS